MTNRVERKLYSLREAYIITYLAFLSSQKFKHAKEHDLLSPQFIERIMLAVIAVNGCDMCSSAHTKMALEAGMTNKEIQNMLIGINSDVPAAEEPAIMFAQHYADYRGKPSQESWQQIINVYGLSKAEGIMGAIRTIMLGNTYGVPWGSFFSRFKGKADKRSSLPYELSMMLGTLFFIPTAFIHSTIAKICKVPLVSF